MSFIFKSVEPSHITISPFYANKLWQIGSTNLSDLNTNTSRYVDSDVSMSIYYGRYNPDPWITSASEERTTHGQFSRTIWHTTYNMFYRNYQTKPLEHNPQGNVGVEVRNITEEIQVWSIPQEIFGLGIEPGSFKVVNGSNTYIDDGNGNIIGGSDPAYLYVDANANFYDCSYYYYEGVFQTAYLGDTTARRTFTLSSHGNLGATANFNYTASKGVALPTHSPATLQATAVNAVVRKYGPDSPYYLDLKPYNNTGSGYVRVPHSKTIDFNQNEDFTIAIWVNPISLSSATLIGKYGREVVRRAPWANYSSQNNPFNQNNIIYGGEIITDQILGGQYPYKIETNASGDVIFSRSDGTTVDTVINNSALSNGVWSCIIASKSGSIMSLYVDGATTTATCKCLGITNNTSDIFVGCSGDRITTGSGASLPTQFYGNVGSFHIFRRALSTNESSNFEVTGLGSGYGPLKNNLGNILYDQGLIVWTAGSSDTIFTTSTTFSSMQFRSRKAITSTEVICVSGPGEHNLTMNPSILALQSGDCNPGIGASETGLNNVRDGIIYSFATGSDFSPYVTAVGLYNDAGELLVVGKLAKPIKKALNCDTIFIVRWDS